MSKSRPRVLRCASQSCTHNRNNINDNINDSHFNPAFITEATDNQYDDDDLGSITSVSTDGTQSLPDFDNISIIEEENPNGMNMSFNSITTAGTMDPNELNITANSNASDNTDNTDMEMKSIDEKTQGGKKKKRKTKKLTKKKNKTKKTKTKKKKTYKKKTKTNLKTRNVHIMMDAQTFKFASKLADDMGLSMSAFVRTLVRARYTDKVKKGA